MYGERFCPAIEQLEEKEALLSRDFICIVDDKDIVGPCPPHPGHAVTRQEGSQIVIGDPAILPTTIREVVKEHVQDLVADVIIRTIKKKVQKTRGNKIIM